MILDLVKTFDAEYFNNINLVASENISSENVRYALRSDFSHRYAFPPKNERDPALWEYPNQATIRKITKETQRLACELFHAQHSDVSLLSGNQAETIILTSFLKRGDTFLSVGGGNGGYFTTKKITETQGYDKLDMPYIDGHIDVVKTAALVKSSGAKLIFLDASMIQFPYPLKALRDAVGEKIIISYDASHTLGIIAGGGFQSPLEEGADFLHGSTHKSLWGPQKALIMSKHARDSALGEKVFKRIIPEFVANPHAHHIAALGIALEESRDFGSAYAHDVVKNAQLFATEATRSGLRIDNGHHGFTKNHQLIINLGDQQKAEDAFLGLEDVGIHCNPMSVPHSKGQGFGLRLGFSEITRRAFKDQDIIHLTKLFVDTVFLKRAKAGIRKDVRALSNAYTHLAYTHDKDAG